MTRRALRFVLCGALAAGSVACGAQSTDGRSDPSTDDAREPPNDTTDSADADDSTNDAPSAAEANGQLLNDLCVQIQAAACDAYADLQACREVLATELDQAERQGCVDEQVELLECRLEHGVRCARAGLRWNSGCELATTVASDCL